ncbi:MAG: DUF433 domain-containing protein, partial [Armatimonadetes bacterium]|nr:DUF433 domain-containing protein [Armatimonadota bacterium]
MPAVVIKHIEKTPDVCGGQARIAGHRIRVMDIVIWHERCGWSPDEIVALHPQLTLAQVYAALAYYRDHVDEIRRAIADEEALVEQVSSRTP